MTSFSRVAFNRTKYKSSSFTNSILLCFISNGILRPSTTSNIIKAAATSPIFCSENEKHRNIDVTIPTYRISMYIRRLYRYRIYITACAGRLEFNWVNQLLFIVRSDRERPVELRSDRYTCANTRPKERTWRRVVSLLKRVCFAALHTQHCGTGATRTVAEEKEKRARTSKRSVDRIFSRDLPNTILPRARRSVSLADLTEPQARLSRGIIMFRTDIAMP